MPGFQRQKIEEDISWWSPSSIRVVVRFSRGQRESKGFQLPSGYVPKLRSGRAVLDGPAATVLVAARRERDRLWEKRRRLESGLPDAEEAAKKVTVSQMYDRLLERTALRKRPATVRSYRSIRKPIEEAFGDLPLIAIRTSDMERWLDQQLQRVSAGSVSHYRQVLIRLFNIAIKADLYPFRNPAAGTEPIATEEKEGRRLSGAEAAAFLQACWQEDRGALWFAFFGTMLFTGLLYLETARLCWEDFRWEDGLCIPNHQKASRRKDAIVITPEWEVAIEHVRPEGALSGLVFRSSTGRPLKYTVARDALIRIGNAAGIPAVGSLGLHALRRTAITAAEVAAQGNATALMRYARQTDINVTRRYLPAVSEEVRQVSLKAAEKLGQKAGIVIPLKPRLKAVS